MPMNDIEKAKALLSQDGYITIIAGGTLHSYSIDTEIGKKSRINIELIIDEKMTNVEELNQLLSFYNKDPKIYIGRKVE